MSSAAAATALLGQPGITIHFEAGNCLQQVICCSKGITGQFDNRKVIIRDSREDEQSQGCLAWLKKWCCCGGGGDQNVWQINLFERYLAAKYGVFAARMAPALTDINLGAMKIQKKALAAGHVTLIEKAAGEIHAAEPNLRKSFQHLRFFDLYQKTTPRGSPVLVSAYKINCFVHENSGEKKFLDEDKLRNEILAIPIYPKLKNEEVNEIVAEIVKDVSQNPKNEYTEKEIRGLIAKHLKIKDCVVQRPAFVEHTRSELLAKLISVTALENLSESDFCELYAALKKASDKSSLASPRGVDDEKGDH